MWWRVFLQTLDLLLAGMCAILSLPSHIRSPRKLQLFICTTCTSLTSFSVSFMLIHRPTKYLRLDSALDVFVFYPLDQPSGSLTLLALCGDSEYKTYFAISRVNFKPDCGYQKSILIESSFLVDIKFCSEFWHTTYIINIIFNNMWFQKLLKPNKDKQENRIFILSTALLNVRCDRNIQPSNKIYLNVVQSMMSS